MKLENAGAALQPNRDARPLPQGPCCTQPCGSGLASRLGRKAPPCETCIYSQQSVQKTTFLQTISHP
ncbi:hypothetical protein C1X72_02620 [Pseudomonas sp. FW306-2-2C-D06B]|nr:hypothetical protein C1X72_02620 [Pseudomonas sp. FW306-2-2C-D06B]PNB02052.1 hypothetical protein C1X74_00115 [Pseudomonas sp. GW460-5]